MRVLFAGGGTGGHINPAISIADYLRKRNDDFEALFIGTKRGLETKLVPSAGYDIKYIDIRGFDRKKLWRNVSVAAKLVKSNVDCVKIIKDFKPDICVLTGGYVSGPVALAAKKCGVPAFIHEQNVYPGLTVKGAVKYVDYVAVSFEETVNHISNKDKCVVTGNPVREELLTADRMKCREKLGISDDEIFVLVFGGSLGAESLNNALVGALPLIKNEKIRILFGTGDRHYKEVTDRLGELPSNITVTPYITNMAEVMAAADLAVTRSGAITVSELACVAKPAVLLPSACVVRNHQEQNANEFKEADAAVMITESQLSPEILAETITALAEDKERLFKMSENMSKLAYRDSLDRIGELIGKMTKQ